MKTKIKILGLALILGFSSLSIAQSNLDRNSSAGCDSTCATNGNNVSESSRYNLIGKPGTTLKKTIPVYVLDGNNMRNPNGYMVLEMTYNNVGVAYMTYSWYKQYALSNEKNDYFFNSTDFNQITFVDVINYGKGR